MKTLTLAAIALVLSLSGCTAPTLSPCITEDQTTPCYWDAATRSNGLGHSFIVTDSGTIVYTS